MNCYAVVAGKDCTVDGSVIFAHNEDSGTDQIVNFWKVEPQTHPKGAMQRLVKGGSVAFPKKTAGYIWCQMPGLHYSDSYLNDYGVAVGTNACKSREENPDLTDGGITLMLRRIVAMRAHNAREGMEIACELLAKFGYGDSGRCMTIADSEEAWLINMVKGKHWAAVRVPDDKVAVLANHYTIHKVDPNDTENYNLSPGLIEHAIENGWYDAEKDGAFDFATVYGTDGARKHRSNVLRAWRGVNLVGNKAVDKQWLLPTFVTPKKKLEVSSLAAILRDHYEGTKYDLSMGYAKCSPYDMKQPTICAAGTSFSTIFQLRAKMPVEIGSILWIAMGHPDTNAFVPWYLGIDSIPPGFHRGKASEAIGKHFDPQYRALPQPDGLALYTGLQNAMRPIYGEALVGVKASRKKLAKSFRAQQGAFEAKVQAIYAATPDQVGKTLTAYTHGLQARSTRAVQAAMAQVIALKADR